MPSASAAILVSRSCGTCNWFVTLTSKPKRARWGNISRSKSICLEASISAKFARPVTLPPGWERLATKPKPYWVRARCHDDWDRARCFSRREVSWKGRGNNHAWIEAHQIVGQIWQAVEIAIGEPKLEADVAALDISELPHGLAKACQIGLQCLRGPGAQNTDHGHHRLLRVSSRWQNRCRTANELKELAALH